MTATNEELEKQISQLKDKLESLEKHINAISMNINNMPSRMQIDSILRQQQSDSIFDFLF